MRLLRFLLLSACGGLGLAPAGLRAQADETWRAWNAPVEPFRIVANIYYVGTADLACYLVATPEGHLLIDGGLPETPPRIRASVAKLGFRLEDVRILLGTHAHADHAGGLAELKQATGARLCVGAADAAQYAAGGKGDFHWGDRLLFPAVEAEERLQDGATITLGGTTVVARHTPGHTRGNLSFTLRVEEAGRPLDVVIAGSVTAPGYRLAGNPAYPEIQTDFEHSFALLRSLPCDVFLAPHAHVFGMDGKRRQLASGPAENPFIDPAGYRAWVARSEAALAAQRPR